MDRIKAAEVFVAIAERHSMAAAAEALDMSRAMVTRYLAEMEDWAAARLLHRSTRRLSLTPAGELALARCRQLLALAGEVALGGAAGAADDEPHGLLRISTSQSLAQACLVPAVASFLQRYPRTQIDLHIDNRAVNLVAERIDLAVRISNELDPNLIARRLGQCASVVCAAPAYLERCGRPQQLQDLTRHNCLTYSYYGKSLWQFEVQGQPQSVAVGGNLSANESVVLLQATLEGSGISLQPLFSARPYLESGRLRALLPECRPQLLGIHGVYGSRRHMPLALRALLDWLATCFEADSSLGVAAASGGDQRLDVDGRQPGSIGFRR